MGQLSDEIRRAIAACGDRGLTRYQIAKLSGVSEAQLSKFMAGKKGLELANLERVLEAAGLEVRVVRLRKAR